MRIIASLVLAVLVAAAIPNLSIAQCPVAPGVWTGHANGHSFAFRIAPSGTVVDSAAVDISNVCSQLHYVASDVAPTVPLQCNPTRFEWSHCRANPPSSKGFRLTVTFDTYNHATAFATFLGLGCLATCDFANDIEMTPATPGSLNPVFAAHHLGGGQIECGITGGGTGLLYDVRATVLGSISILTQPVDLFGPAGVSTFLVNCSGTGGGSVAVQAWQGTQYIGASLMCFQCSGGSPTDGVCTTPPSTVPALSPAGIWLLIVACGACGFAGLRQRAQRN